jgi:RsiW-degrading membrane proteinase PrsW (M82 family)
MKIAFKYALIYSGINIVWGLLMYVTDLTRSDFSSLLNILSMIIPIVCIVLAVKEYKATQGNGWMKFSDVFKHGLVIFTVGGIIAAAYSVFYITVMDPELMTFIQEKQMTKMIEMGMPEEQIEMAINQSAKFQTPGWMFTWVLLWTMFIGTLISLVMAAILKKPNPEEIS